MTNITDIFKSIRKRPQSKVEPEANWRFDKNIFAAMPYSPKYDDTFLIAIEGAAIKTGYDCKRIDYSGHYGDVVAQIKSDIAESVVVIADLSESRPNVCYEIGLSEALGKPVLQICSTKINQIPFDLRNNYTIPYSLGQTHKLRSRLITELEKI